MSKRLIIVDVSSFIFRSFFAIRPLTAPDGTPSNAVLGVFNMLYKLLSDYRPTNIFLARDIKGKTFRHKLYKEYKANRDEPPEELVPQFALIKELIDKMGLHNHELKNYEADDIIGSAVVQWKKDFDEVLIISSDKDLMQFLDDEKVFMVDTMKDLKIGADGVFKKLGVYPNQIVDYLSMLGDASDNIPGMKGIGKVGAAKLLAEYGTLENCIKNKDSFKGKKLVNAFENHLDDAILSKELIEIKTDLDLGMKASETKYEFFPSADLIDFLKNRMGFKTASKKVEDLAFEIQKEESENTEDNFKIIDTRVTLKDFKFKIVDSDKEFKKVLKALKENKIYSFDTHYDSKDFFKSKITYVGISFDGKLAYYLPFNILTKEHLKELLEVAWGAKKKEILGGHFKRDFRYAFRSGLDIGGRFFDNIQAHYDLEPDESHDFPHLCSRYLDHTLVMRDKKDLPLEEWDTQKACEYIGERACCHFLLAEILKSELNIHQLEDVYTKLDAPMMPILAKMELAGILINKEYFSELEQEFSEQLEFIEQEVKSAIKDSGKKVEGVVNLRSPKQVGELLFETLELPVIKTTKTGFSTDSSVLEELISRELSDIPALILHFREIDKLLSTYVRALPELIYPETGRLHTTFGLHTAATGRLVSVNPNLQNIPIRTLNGKRIRKGLIADKGNILLSADYSQVELRLLAHFSKDPTMLKAFKNGVDIHTQTASEVLNVDIKKVNKEQRSLAKAVNFGLMYGQSSFGLAQQLKISRKEAKEYITSYFAKFSKIKGYLDTLKEAAELHGFSTTLHGRKRLLPDIKSHNRTIKSAAERLAVNSPIQGTAADILKLAMIEIDKNMKEQKLKSKMLLQVHDELIFEVPEKELTRMKKLVKDGMENIVKLEVPLDVEIGLGVNWLDLK
ncbi:MAG: DNA polymerase I [Epsilonproteobacteria bacterium]|nr:MAG: DNA polymerase I [Campylobacterota bacterium]